jgi:hypothetical protein
VIRSDPRRATAKHLSITRRRSLDRQSLTMSDSDTSTRPSDAAISRSLRDVVVSLYKAGNTDELTVKRVRARTEDALGLPTGFLKTDSLWKQKSSDVIKDAVVRVSIPLPLYTSLNQCFRTNTAMTMRYQNPPQKRPKLNRHRKPTSGRP